MNLLEIIFQIVNVVFSGVSNFVTFINSVLAYVPDIFIPFVLFGIALGLVKFIITLIRG